MQPLKQLKNVSFLIKATSEISRIFTHRETRTNLSLSNTIVNSPKDPFYEWRSFSYSFEFCFTLKRGIVLVSNFCSKTRVISENNLNENEKKNI